MTRQKAEKRFKISEVEGCGDGRIGDGRMLKPADSNSTNPKSASTKDLLPQNPARLSEFRLTPTYRGRRKFSSCNRTVVGLKPV